jgi:hypothetical protein
MTLREECDEVRTCRDAYRRIAGQWEREPDSWDEPFHQACRILFLSHVASELGLTSYTIDRLLLDGNVVDAWCHDEADMTALLQSAGFGVVTAARLAPRCHPSPMARRYGPQPYQLVARATR